MLCDASTCTLINSVYHMSLFPHDSCRAETLSEMLASVRRQGVRGDSLLKDSDNLIQRYRNLQARLQKQVETQSALEGEYDRFNFQAESTRMWITDLLQPLTSALGDTQTEEMKCKAQVGDERSMHLHQKMLTYIFSLPKLTV